MDGICLNSLVKIDFAMSTRGRPRLLTKNKIDILKVVDSGLRKSDVAAKDNVVPRSVSNLLHKPRERPEAAENFPSDNRDQLVAGRIPEKFEQPHSSGGVPRKHVRNAILHDVERALLKWLQHARARNMGLTGNLLKEKAERFAALLGDSEFRASSSWLERFKTKHDVPFIVPSGRRTAGDRRASDEWRQYTLPKLLAKYEPQDVFHVEETGIFYRVTPPEVASFSSFNCAGGQRPKDRLTVLLCSNLDDSERRPLVVVGHTSNPKSLVGVRSSPALYHCDPSSWMTGDIYGDFLRNFNDAMRAKKRRVLLVVDNSTCHDYEDISRLDSVRVEVAPGDCGALASIGCHLKRVYRRRLLQRMVIDSYRRRDTRVTIKNAVDLLAASWKLVEHSKIERSFRLSGFCCQQDEEEKEEEEMEVEQAELQDYDAVTETEDRLWSVALDRLKLAVGSMTFLEYVYVDAKLATSASFTDEEIVASVIGTGYADSLDASDPDSDEEDCHSGDGNSAFVQTAGLPATASVNGALSAINELRLFLQSRSNLPCDLLDNVSHVEDCVLRSVWSSRCGLV